MSSSTNSNDLQPSFSAIQQVLQFLNSQARAMQAVRMAPLLLPLEWNRRFLNGYFTMPEQGFDGPVGGWWAVREMVDEGGVVPTVRS
jgi:hypothetical protein